MLTFELFFGICSAIGLDSKAIGQWFVRRSIAMAELQREVRTSLLPVELRGSWLHGDFHLLADGMSYSDIDFIYTGERSADIPATLALMSLHLEKSISVAPKISIHPTDTFASVSLADQRFLARGEFLILEFSGIDDAQRSAHVSKVALSIMRAHAEERYCEVAHRLGGYFARVAASKLGVTRDVDPNLLALELSRNSMSNPDIIVLSDWLRVPPNIDVVNLYIEELRSREGLSLWLRQYMESKINSVR